MLESIIQNICDNEGLGVDMVRRQAVVCSLVSKGASIY